MSMRVKILARQPGPDFHAEVGEERTVSADLGGALVRAGHAELLAATWPPKAVHRSPPKSRAPRR